MKIALVGASGNVGSRILKELSDRHHAVTAIARRVEAIPSLPGVTAVAGDAADPAHLAGLIAGHDAVVSALRFLDQEPQSLIRAVRISGVRRYLVVGGAGSLEVGPGVKLIDTPDFPEAYKSEAAAGSRFLDALRQQADLEWTFLSPSAVLSAGERTGRFRLGGDQLLTHAGGSSISYEDYAVALADEIESPAHVRERFTVGY
ncbi:NAD(P)-dependent oxidoreductase [Aurantimonas sp. MSK8Z-1]|uniref:NAD(P)-dependent oxidoreductase n=1 Tax=Mangrovibrevibacter kandeliae TaxID=2968473 RepID=UPI0021199D50|nr:NAD(P)-dependent oxidoreductase [Aurantimonas sp. MSK8Z-1]MCW4117043.1 NAD(P)-dependent oxidoreductase [Aurantimonas sp. MSK8Z-1]